MRPLPRLLVCSVFLAAGLRAQTPTRILGEPLRHHDNMVRAVDFHPDGKRALSAGWDDKVRVWSLESSKPLLILEAKGQLLSQAAFCKDGARILMLDPDGTLRTFDSQSGAVVAEKKTAKKYGLGAVSPDGRFLATHGDADKDGADIVDLETLEPVQHVPWSKSMLTKFAWSPDSRYALFGGSLPGKVVVWDVKEKKLAADVTMKDFVTGLAVRPDGAAVAIVQFPKIVVRPFPKLDGETIAEVPGSRNPMHCINWADQERVLIGDSDGTMLCIDVAKSDLAWGCAEHRDAVYSIARSKDGKLLASASGDNTLRFWNAADGSEVLRKGCSRDLVRALAWSPDGSRLAAGDYGNMLVRYDLKAGSGVSALALDASVVAVHAADDGRTVALGRDGKLLVLAPDGKTELLTVPVDGELDPRCAAFTEKLCAIGCGDGAVRGHDLGSAAAQFEVYPFSKSIVGVAIHRDGSRIAVCSESGELKTLDGDGENQLLVTDEFESVHYLAFVDATHLAALSDKGLLRIYELGDEPKVAAEQQLELGEDETTTGIAASRDGTLLAVLADKHVFLCKGQDGSVRHTCAELPGIAASLALSDDGKTLALGMLDSTTQLFDVPKLLSDGK
ncbi:MAG: WD40 repeat domain-containing protein [Planctomycetota bacterium]